MGKGIEDWWRSLPKPMDIKPLTDELVFLGLNNMWTQRAEWLEPTAALDALPENEALEALIPCMRESAQGTLAALDRAGFVIARKP